jgi:hypothetical protein
LVSAVGKTMTKMQGYHEAGTTVFGDVEVITFSKH